MRSLRLAVLGVTGLAASIAHGQAAATANPFDEHTAAQLREQAAVLLKQAAASPSGVVSVTLESYPGHSTMLTVRTKSAGAEMHQHFNDIFFILDGEATEVVGGALVDRKDGANGESRGSSVAGGERHPMRKGDIVHISPGVPHQLLLEPGKTVVYYVIKVEQK